MKPTVFFRALSATAILALLADSAAAQAAQAGQPSAATSTGAPTPWPARPIGRYELEITLPDKVMPAVVVIADSSGVPAAVLQPEGDPDPHAMKVTVKGTELYLNATADRGAIELVLLRSGDVLSGRWSYGEGKGELKGHVSK